MYDILIVDDHAVVCGGLRQFLAGRSDCQIAGEAHSGAEALTQIAERPWDLVLLDIGLPDINGLEVLRRIRLQHTELPVLIFSMHTEDEYAIASLQAGATGYLPKDSAPEEILNAIRRATGGNKYVSPHLADKLLSGVIATSKPLRHDSLSPREADVMRRISHGESLTHIGNSLHLSPKTITTYRTRIFEKLGVDSNAELTRYVIEHKLDT
jgi:two-component system, NarL family, invasion response regulator UvrY